MHSVYINNKLLRFIHIYDRKDLDSAGSYPVFSGQEKSMDEIISLMEDSNGPPVVFHASENPDSSWNLFLSHCTLVEAAGGLVQNNKGEFLFIYRLNKWDLPKGKMEYDESPQETAIREVEEECGIKNLSIIRKLPLTFHTYILNQKRKLKKTHWFLMHTDYSEKLVPQLEEDIREARWMNEEEIRTVVLTNTYSSISGLLREFFQLKQEAG